MLDHQLIFNQTHPNLCYELQHKTSRTKKNKQECHIHPQENAHIHRSDFRDSYAHYCPPSTARDRTCVGFECRLLDEKWIVLSEQ